MVELKGEHKCFVCENQFKWQGAAAISYLTIRTISDIQAELTAIDIDDNNKPVFEVKVYCPRCRTLNKFQSK